MTPAEALLAATMAANLATETANMAQEAAYAAQAAEEAVRAAQAAASSSTRNFVVVPQGLVRSRRRFPRLPKIFKKKSPILYRMSGKPRKQSKQKARQTNKRKSSLQTVPVEVPVEIRSRSHSPEAMHSSRRQRRLPTPEYALPVPSIIPVNPMPIIPVDPMDTRTQGGRLTDRKKTKKQKKHRRK